MRLEDYTLVLLISNIIENYISFMLLVELRLTIVLREARTNYLRC